LWYAVPLVEASTAQKDPIGTDPKKSHGDKKPQLQLIPAALNTEMAKALQNGADKYGAWNWRDNAVELMTYIGAMRRHLDDFVEGQDNAPDSGVHHLGHIAANCAILLDAAKHGMLVDNRPPERKFS
jgi:hypothetical protein